MNKERNENQRSSHTPGPWRWVTTSRFNWMERQRIFLISKNDEIVLQPTIVSGDHDLDDLPVTIFGRNVTGNFLEDLADYLEDGIISHPDARLIAAAPELLEAAEIGLEWIKEYIEETCIGHKERIEMRKDIEKIEGVILRAKHGYPSEEENWNEDGSLK